MLYKTEAIIKSISDKKQRIILVLFLLLSSLCTSLLQAEGWKSPDSVSDPEGKWKNESRCTDGNTGTYADDHSLRTGWGAYIVLNYNQAVSSNRVRVNSDWWTGAVDKIDLDVFKDGSWLDVHEGAVAQLFLDREDLCAGTGNQNTLQIPLPPKSKLYLLALRNSII